MECYDMMQNEHDSEEAWDQAICALGEMILEEENGPSVLNFHRLRQMEFSLAALKHVMKDSDVEIRYILHEPFQSMGSIQIEGDLISFDYSQWFSRALEFCDGIEICAMTNGKVRLDLTFHNLVRRI